MDRFFVAILGALLVSTTMGTVQADEEKAPKVTCPVSGQPVDKDATVEYKGGKVAFCCGQCVAAFGRNTAKFAAKANHQLALTKQAKLVKCPFSGGGINPDTTIDVAGVKVGFCCNVCKGKAQSTEDKVALLFQDAAFAKGFEIKKPDAD